MTGPLLPPDGASLLTIPAGRYGVQVLTDGVAPDDWVFINGITSFEPKFDVQTEDDTDITSDGWKSEAPVGNGLTVDLQGLVKGTETGGVFSGDPGMQVLIEASEQTGTDAVQKFRYWRTDGLDQAYEFPAVVKCSPSGGKPNELQKFGGQLICRGKPVKIVKPVAIP